jgi:hypothetical protein
MPLISIIFLKSIQMNIRLVIYRLKAQNYFLLNWRGKMKAKRKAAYTINNYMINPCLIMLVVQT